MKSPHARTARIMALIILALSLPACTLFKRPPLPTLPAVERASPENEVIKVVYSRHFTERFLPDLADEERLVIIRDQARKIDGLFCRNTPLIHQQQEHSEIMGLGEQQWVRIYKLVECDLDTDAMAAARRDMDWKAVLYDGVDTGTGDVGGDHYEFRFAKDFGRMELTAGTSIQSGNFFVVKTRYIQEFLKQ